jgi:hypothetical protein
LSEKATENSSEVLEDFLRRVVARVEYSRAIGEVDPGIDRHFERTFSDLRSALSYSTERLDDLIEEISRSLEARFSNDVVASRIPGLTLVHRLVGRLVRRHVSPAYVAVEQCRISLVEASAQLHLLSKMTPGLRSQPLSSDIWDRLATLDALEAEVRLLKSRFSTPSTSD